MARAGEQGNAQRDGAGKCEHTKVEGHGGGERERLRHYRCRDTDQEIGDRRDGTHCDQLSNGGFLGPVSCIPIPMRVSTPLIQGRSRMRKFRSYGSVRGAVSDGRPYRDTQVLEP